MQSPGKIWKTLLLIAALALPALARVYAAPITHDGHGDKRVAENDRTHQGPAQGMGGTTGSGGIGGSGGSGGSGGVGGVGGGGDGGSGGSGGVGGVGGGGGTSGGPAPMQR